MLGVGLRSAGVDAGCHRRSLSSGACVVETSPGTIDSADCCRRLRSSPRADRSRPRPDRRIARGPRFKLSRINVRRGREEPRAPTSKAARKGGWRSSSTLPSARAQRHRQRREREAHRRIDGAQERADRMSRNVCGRSRRTDPRREGVEERPRMRPRGPRAGRRRGSPDPTSRRGGRAPARHPDGGLRRHRRRSRRACATASRSRTRRDPRRHPRARRSRPDARRPDPDDGTAPDRDVGGRPPETCGCWSPA